MTPSVLAASASGATTSSTTQADQQVPSTSGLGLVSRATLVSQQSIITRPDDLGVTPWFFEDYGIAEGSPGPMGNRSSYPPHLFMGKEAGKPELTSTRNSSMESEAQRATSIGVVPRKAYMNLKDAIALLDETCPNQEPSPSLTPRTPRTPLTPHPRNKRARSKSSDNSSNYSNERLSDRSFETPKPEKEKKRPFLKKIGISRTEDRPFLSKLAPKIIGKPYLEKIGPSKAVEKPFLDKIGSSKTLDKFTFDTLRLDAKCIARSGAERIVERDRAAENPRGVAAEKKVTRERDGKSRVVEAHQADQGEQKLAKGKMVDRKYATEKRRSGKGFLLKMYSFETEDLESTVQQKDHRDPLRGASLDDVLDSGPSSLPLETSDTQPLKSELENRPTSVAALVKCRVTTSAELIFSSHGSPKELDSSDNSPQKAWISKNGTPKTPTHRKTRRCSREGLRSDESTPNSPTKRPISTVSPDRQVVSTSDPYARNIYSPTKTRKQTSEDLLNGSRKEDMESKANKQAQFERRGISSDNLLSRDIANFDHRDDDHIQRTRETASEDSLATHSAAPQYTKETFKQLQDKFRAQEIPTETYADFKRRTRGNVANSIARMHERKITSGTVDEKVDASNESMTKSEQELKSIGTTGQSKSEEGTCSSEVMKRHGGTIRSVLRKQEGIDSPSDHESDTNSSLRRPKRRIFHEPSQETMDLLTELRKVKSLLKAPSWEKDLDLDKKPARTPKRVLLTDKEFCLSVERENSVRRLSRAMCSVEKVERRPSTFNGKAKSKSMEEQDASEEEKTNIAGPALFEKKCLSLEYADEERSQKPEIRTVSLTSATNLPTEIEGIGEYSDFTLLCASPVVFDTRLDKLDQGHESDLEDLSKRGSQNHCTEVEAVPTVAEKTGSSKDRVQVEERTSDPCEMMSPRSTPFRAKKRLGKISVEEAVKPESFTLGSKVDCRTVSTQKRTKCFPL